MTTRWEFGMHMNLGANTDIRPGWINVDIFPYSRNRYRL